MTSFVSNSWALVYLVPFWNESLFLYLLMCLKHSVGGKQCRIWSDIVFFDVLSGSTIFA